jgi:hypothetical protein
MTGTTALNFCFSLRAGGSVVLCECACPCRCPCVCVCVCVWCGVSVCRGHSVGGWLRRSCGGCVPYCFSPRTGAHGRRGAHRLPLASPSAPHPPAAPQICASPSAAPFSLPRLLGSASHRRACLFFPSFSGLCPMAECARSTFPSALGPPKVTWSLLPFGYREATGKEREAHDRPEICSSPCLRSFWADSPGLIS